MDVFGIRAVCWHLLLVLSILLTGCGGGASGSPSSTTTTTTATLTATLVDNTGVPNNNVAIGVQSTLKISVLDSTGKPIPNAIVTVANSTATATLVPSSGSTLSDAAGNAVMGMVGVAEAADTVTVTATYKLSDGSSKSSSVSLNYVVVPNRAQANGPVLTVSLFNASGAASNRVSIGGQSTIKINLLDTARQPVADAIITVRNSLTTATLVPASGSTLTDKSGNATLTLTGVSEAADTLTVTASFKSGGVAQEATTTLNYLSSGTGGSSLMVSLLDSSGAANSLLAVGTQSTISVMVFDALGKPVPKAIVTASNSSTTATLVPASGSALTDANGRATLGLLGVAQAADTLKVTTSFTQSDGSTATLTQLLNYAVTPASGSAAARPTLSLRLTASGGGSQVQTGVQSKLVATALAADGKPVPDVIVTFSNDSTYATFSPASATALTDANGQASINVTGTAKLGADILRASASLPSASGVDADVTASVNYQVVASTLSSESLTLSLVDAQNMATNSISAGKNGTLTATLTDARGAPIPNAVLSFDVDSNTLVNLPTQSALTNSAGVASTAIVPNAGAANGVATVTVTAQFGGKVVTAVKSFNVISSAPTPRNITVAYRSGAASIPSGSSVGITASIVDATTGLPFTDAIPVLFSSACSLQGRATITSPVINVGGTVNSTYTDAGCGNNDVITASVVFGGSTRSSTVNIAIASPKAASLIFVSATPSSLGIKGSGVAETSQVVFRLVDINGNPIAGQQINFSLDTRPGGAALNSSFALTDTNGQVTALLQAGTIGAPLTVNAVLASDPSINTQSARLFISTRIPHQNGFTLAATLLNPEFLDEDGAEITVTASLSDRFGNPVPDGTAVSFRTPSGVGRFIDTSNGSPAGSCLVKDSACTIKLISSGNRSQIYDNGLMSIMAYAVGEDSFSDLNGDGVFSVGDIFPPQPPGGSNSGGASYNRGEAFIDSNLNGVRDFNEEFIDYNNDGIYNAPDNLYRGYSCAAGAACSSAKTRHVYRNMLIVWSGSTARFNALQGVNASGNIVISSGGACSAGASSTVVLRITDQNNHVLPFGTTIAVATTNGTLDENSASFTVPNTTQVQDYPIVIKSDATLDATTGLCTNTTPSGAMTITVTTPRGIVTKRSYAVQD